MDALQEETWIEQPVAGQLKTWQIVFLAVAALVALVIALCCCIRFRVPRTKQEIEANYQRRVITKKFREQLEKIQNSQMDAIDLKTALEMVKADCKAEDEGNDRDQPQSVSLISSIANSDEASLTAVKQREGAEKASGIRLGKKLFALVRFSQQQQSQNNQTDIAC